MKARGIFAVLAAQVAGLLIRSAHTLGLARRSMRDTSYGRNGHHGRGKYGQRGLVGKPGAKLWHRLTTGHSTAGLSDRSTRRWYKTGRWSEPRAEHRKRKAEAMEATA